MRRRGVALPEHAGHEGPSAAASPQDTREMEAVEHSLDVRRANRQGSRQMCAALYMLSIPMRALHGIQRVFMLSECVKGRRC